MSDLQDFKLGISIERYNGSDTIVKIPAEINGVHVTEISKYAFNEYQINLFEKLRNLEEVYIPNYVTYIGKYAFAHCSNLNKITIASEYSIFIDKTAFIGCCRLTEIVITANNPIGINFDAFEDCYGIERVYIDTSKWSYASVKETFGDDPDFEILPLE